MKKKRKLVKTGQGIWERIGEEIDFFIPKYNKKRRKKHHGEKIWKRAGKKNRHHIINKCRGGTWNPKNILNLDINRHNAWHFLFQNLSFREVIELLERTLKYQENKTV